MTPAQAAAVLRRPFAHTASEHANAAEMAHEALELLEWQRERNADVNCVDGVWFCQWYLGPSVYRMIIEGATPLEALANARAKEGA